MISGTSLLTQIPATSCATQPKVYEMPAAVSVADVIKNEKAEDTRNFFQKFIDNQKEKYIQRRMKNLESKPIESLSENERAELEANKKASSKNGYIA